MTTAARKSDICILNEEKTIISARAARPTRAFFILTHSFAVPFETRT